MGHKWLLMVCLCLLSVLLAPGRLQARTSEGAMWSYLSLSKALDDRWTLATQTELRTGNENHYLYLWYLDGTVRYKVCNWLSASTGFDYIKIHSRATATRPAVWRTDWRPYVALTPSWKLGPLRCNFYEGYSYNWLPATEVDGIKVKKSRFYILRHRLHVQYPIPNTRFSPYARIEVRHNEKLERIRYTLATNIRVNAHQSIDVGYIYQEMHKGMKTHALSLGYRYTL